MREKQREGEREEKREREGGGNYLYVLKTSKLKAGNFEEILFKKH